MRYTIGDKITEYIDINDSVFEEIFKVAGINSMWTHYHSIEPLYTMYKNLEYVVKHDIPGDIVECGVWRGGMMQLTALTLLHLGDTERNIFLYDTFDGMPEPDQRDLSADGGSAHAAWKMHKDRGEKWGFGGQLKEIEDRILGTGYPAEKCVFVKGMVENTIPAQVPNDSIAILRLDTDLYSSTRHELNELYPKLSTGGILIIDDYGYFQGAREATDEYLEENNIKMLLTRINLSVHQGVKMPAES